METVRCALIACDCVVNDPVDVRCGGPSMLGFDFNVPVAREIEMTNIIKALLEKYNIPVLGGVYVTDYNDVPKAKVWDEASIEAEIAGDAEMLIETHRRDYGHFNKHRY